MKRASKWKRFLAALVDGIFSVALGFVPVLGIVLAVAYTLLKDGMHLSGLKGRSLGKSLLRLNVVDVESRNDRHGWLDSLKRNILLMIPFMGIVESIVVLVDKDGRRLGDRIAATLVVQDS